MTEQMVGGSAGVFVSESPCTYFLYMLTVFLSTYGYLYSTAIY